MRRRRPRAVLALAALAALLAEQAGAQSIAPGPTCADRQTGVPAPRIAALRRGFNLTGWLDTKPGTKPDIAALRALRSRGFTHIRLPVKAEYYIPEFAGPEAVSGQLRALAAALDELLGLGFAVSLDMHPGEEIAKLRKEDPKLAVATLDALWRRLATRFAGTSPDRVFFEVLNEPETATDYAAALRFAATVRAAAPSHTIILGPPNYQRVEALEAVTPLPDRNIVYAIHVYDPMAFTHQGAEWEGPEEPRSLFRGVPFPSRPDHPAVRALGTKLAATGHQAAADALAEQMAEPWDEKRLDRIFARAEAWSLRAKAPVIVNEFGVLSWHAPPGDRARWLGAVRRSAEAHCIGWTHWDYADGFGFMRRKGGRETPDPAILDALVGP